ncbi:MAG: alpha/beta hydrolase [Anaeromyxobacter sp.]
MRAARTDLADLHGWARLAFDATLGVTAVVEAMHHAVRRLAPPLGPAPAGAPGGITGLVYRSIRGVTRTAGAGVELAARLAPPEPRRRSARRQAVVAALNGVVGDHLAASGNPLALEMALCSAGEPLSLEQAALARAFPAAPRRVLVLVHGACQDDLRWRRRGHDHGAALAAELGVAAVYVRYNTGRHVSDNGRALAALLERLVAAWPAPAAELSFLAHSMGGLVTRSALHAGEAAGHAWPGRARELVFLGTPHHGSPLERGGHWLDLLLGQSPYAAPIGRLGRIRSAGVTDLRHGSLVEADWRGRDRFGRRGRRPTPVPLPAGVRAFAVAATLARAPGLRDGLGDGLVPLASALGDHAEPGRALGIPPGRRFIARGRGHFDLLDNPAVYAQLRAWLAR